MNDIFRYLQLLVKTDRKNTINHFNLSDFIEEYIGNRRIYLPFITSQFKMTEIIHSTLTTIELEVNKIFGTLSRLEITDFSIAYRSKKKKVREIKNYFE